GPLLVLVVVLGRRGHVLVVVVARLPLVLVDLLVHVVLGVVDLGVLQVQLDVHDVAHRTLVVLGQVVGVGVVTAGELLGHGVVGREVVADQRVPVLVPVGVLLHRRVLVVRRITEVLEVMRRTVVPLLRVPAGLLVDGVLQCGDIFKSGRAPGAARHRGARAALADPLAVHGPARHEGSHPAMALLARPHPAPPPPLRRDEGVPGRRSLAVGVGDDLHDGPGPGGAGDRAHRVAVGHPGDQRVRAAAGDREAVLLLPGLAPVIGHAALHRRTGGGQVEPGSAPAVRAVGLAVAVGVAAHQRRLAGQLESVAVVVLRLTVGELGAVGGGDHKTVAARVPALAAQQHVVAAPDEEAVPGGGAGGPARRRAA